MQKRYPFKYLDAYTRSDKDIYFGREEEVDQLYEMIFQTNLLLVYGASGTGKTSLIQCGLANRFESHDWMALTVRRGNNINQSLEKVLNEAGGSDTNWNQSDESSPLAQKIKAIRLKYFRPIYLIFDQFEELYILGEKKEQEQFYQTIKQLLTLNQPVKIIITIREEYLGYLYSFEQVIPDILRKKLRIEPMTSEKVNLVLRGINNPKKSLVTLQEGEEDELIEKIFNKLREGKISIDLPYLQVLLDKLYLSVTHNDEQHETEAVFTLAALEKLGDVGDILFGLLNSLVLQYEETKGTKQEIVWNVLSCFVTIKGTKEPLSKNTAYKRLKNIDNQTIDNIFLFFETKKILRKNDQVYEIAHDKLAEKIHGNRTKEEIGRLKAKETLKAKINLQEPLTVEQINEIDQYIKQPDLLPEENEWVEQSRKIVDKAERKKRRELFLTRLALAVAVVFLVFAGWQYINAEKAKDETQQALNQTEKLVNAFYFYNGKFALACKKDFYYDNNNNYIGKDIFYFIDKNGDEVTKLGRWDKAEQFDSMNGYAKVTKENVVYVLDTLGVSYKYANDIKNLDSTIEALDLSNQNLSKFPIEITNYTNLKVLWLYQNKITVLPDEIGRLSDLNCLYLWKNRLHNLPSGIGKLTNLSKLGLEGNFLTDLPDEIFNLTNLTQLNLLNNKLTFLSSKIEKLNKLEYLAIGNQDSLLSVPAEIFTLKKLKYLYLFSILSDNFSKEIGNLTDLTVLNLSDNKLKSLPVEIGKLTKLTTLCIFNTEIQSIPAEIGKLTKLTKLYLVNNEIQNIPVEIGKLTDLTGLYLSFNNLESLPKAIGNLINLTNLDLSSNRLESLPKTIGNLINLTNLDLSSNRLASLPAEIGKLIDLTDLNLSQNNLECLPKEIVNLVNLTNLDLCFNELESLPAELWELTKLTDLDLTCNYFLGSKLPKEVGNLTNLSKLGIGTLAGLPAEFWNLTNLTELKFSHSQDENLPPEIEKLINLTELDLSYSKLSSLPKEIYNLTNLTKLGLYGNHLTELPSEIEKLINLTDLDLSNNQLESLPKEICNLTNLTKLDLYRNSLTDLPPEIKKSTNFNLLKGVADNYYEQEKYDIALVYFQQGLNIIENLAKEDTQTYMAEILYFKYQIALIYNKLRNYDQALQIFRANIDLMNTYKEDLLQIYFRQFWAADTHYNVTLAENYGRLSFVYILTKEYLLAEQSAKKAVELDEVELYNAKSWIKKNLAHALLFQGHFQEAQAIYEKLHETHAIDGMVFFNDFDEFEKAGDIPEDRKKDIKQMRKLFQEWMEN
jgi:Leucine-rich repeat (LRR) protein